MFDPNLVINSIIGGIFFAIFGYFVFQVETNIRIILSITVGLIIFFSSLVGILLGTVLFGEKSYAIGIIICLMIYILAVFLNNFEFFKNIFSKVK